MSRADEERDENGQSCEGCGRDVSACTCPVEYHDVNLEALQEKIRRVLGPNSQGLVQILRCAQCGHRGIYICDISFIKPLCNRCHPDTRGYRGDL